MVAIGGNQRAEYKVPLASDLLREVIERPIFKAK